MKQGNRRLLTHSAVQIGIVLAALSVRVNRGAHSQINCAPKIDHFEITQATQRTHNPAPYEYSSGGTAVPPGITLLDGRSTAVRAFIREDNGGEGCPIGKVGSTTVYNISGFGSVTASGPLPGIVGAALASPTNKLAPPWNRDVEESTMNFDFLPSSITGQDRNLLISLCIGVPNSQGTGFLPGTTDCHAEFLTFTSVWKPNIVGFPVNYEPRALGTPLPTTVEEQGDDMAWALWPLPDLGPGGYRAVDIDFTWPASRGELNDKVDGIPNALNLLDDIYEYLCTWEENDDVPETERVPVPDVLAAWLPFDALLSTQGNNAGRGYNRGLLLEDGLNVAEVNFAHEFGHAVGFRGHENENVDETGWDVLRRMKDFFPRWYVRTSSRTRLMHELNTFNGDHWIHSDAYQDRITEGHIFERVACDSNNVPVLPPTPEVSFYHVGGTIPIDPPGQGSFFPMLERSRRVIVSSVGGGDGELRVFDAQNTLVFTTTVEIHAADGVGAFWASIPGGQGTNRVELHYLNQLQYSVSRSSNDPQVSITSPVAGQTLTSTLIVEWQATDQDNDQVYANIAYSQDDGKTWIPLAIRDTSGVFSTSTSKLASSLSGRIRVSVTDGMNTKETEVTNLQLGPNRPPTVSIVSPSDAISVPAGTNLQFIASSFDLEDGWLSEQELTSGIHSLSWSTPTQGVIGTGPGLNLSTLPVGVHQVTVTATDLDGALATDSVVVSVVP